MNKYCNNLRERPWIPVIVTMAAGEASERTITSYEEGLNYGKDE